MLMKKLFTYLVALVACLGFSVNANAQFSATAEMYPGTSWEDGYKDVELDLAAVAEALGTDAATLVSTLDAWMNNEAPEVFLFQKNDFVPTSLADYTADYRGFWMKLDGTVVSYGQKESEDGPELQDFYAFFWWNADEGKFFVRIGQMPNKLNPGAQGNATFVIAIGDKKATFDISLTIIEKETPDIPDPVTDLNALTIVGSKDIAWDQYPNMPCDQSVDISDALQVLGIDEAVFSENLSSFLFMTTLELKGEDEDSQKPYKTSTISNGSTAGGFGFWMAHIWDDELEGFSEEAVRCNWSDHAAFRVMYSEQYSFDAATHTLNSVTGWESYSLELGTKYNFDLYIVYGNKAFKLHHVVTLTQKPEEDPNKWTKIGEEAQTVEIWKGDYYETMNLDLDAIAAALECEVANLKVYGPSDDKGNIDDRHTANNGGMWFSGAGNVCSWNGSDDGGSPFTFYIEPVNNQDFSSWNVGQNANQTEVGSTYSTTLFFFNGNKSDTNNKYYAVNVTINITKEPTPDVEFESVVEYTLVARAEPSATTYPIDDSPAIDLDALEAAIGTRAPVFYAWVKTSDGTDYSKAWNCTPYPGFWMDAEGYSVGWGANAICGASYLSDGSFSLFQYPGRCENGYVWKTTLFLVNAETGKMATVHLSIAFGDVVNFEEVGSKDITLFADPDTEHEVAVVDFADALEAMGVEDVSVLLSGQSVAALTADATWSDPQMPSEGIALDDKGFFNTEATAFTIYMTPGTGTNIEMSIDNETATEIEPDFKMPVKLAIQRDVEGSLKQYTLNVSVVSMATVGVNDLKGTADKAIIYDLSGRRSEATRKGVYIQNGKKVVK